jgi:predicted DNA-binding transcriptional regulator YafY
LLRQWHIVLALQGVQRGLTRKQLMERLEISKSTLHRELNTLLEAGAPLTSEGVNGTTRWRLLGQSELPPLGFTPLQVAVLHLARLELEPLAGSKAVTALDELLVKFQPRQQQPRQQQLPLRIAEAPRGSPQIMAAIEEALRRRRRLRFDYAAVSRQGKPEQVNVEPLLVNVADRDPYLLGYCLERNDERTYKLARISACEVREDKADRRPAPGLAKAFRHSVKAWTGERVRVRIALTPRVAWLASEYPLIANQHIEAQPDGSAIISAEVAGTVEAMRWILSWGGQAEALEPPELRNSTRQELEAAAARYQQDPEPGRTSRLKHAGTGRR